MLQEIVIMLAASLGSAGGSASQGEELAFRVCEGLVLSTVRDMAGAQVPRVAASRDPRHGYAFEWKAGDGLRMLHPSGGLLEFRARCDTDADANVTGLMVNGHGFIDRPLTADERAVQQRIEAANERMRLQRDREWHAEHASTAAAVEAANAAARAAADAADRAAGSMAGDGCTPRE